MDADPTGSRTAILRRLTELRARKAALDAAIQSLESYMRRQAAWSDIQKSSELPAKKKQ